MKKSRLTCVRRPSDHRGVDSRSSRGPVLPRSLARNLAFHALDVEHHATQELVVGHRVFGQHFLASLVHDRAFPDGEAAVFQTLAKDAVADDKFLGGVMFYVKGVEGKIPGK